MTDFDRWWLDTLGPLANADAAYTHAKMAWQAATLANRKKGTMEFKKWWLSQPLDIRKMGPSMAAVEASWRAAWEAATAAERERCAKVCEEQFWDDPVFTQEKVAHDGTIRHCAAAIRARGGQK